MPIPCRVLPHREADGPANMAMDEALLDEVAADPAAASFRTYGWSVPTLSLGYFQEIGRAEADPRWRGAAIVRRASGGGALWHDLELTYALVIPRAHPLARRSIDLYRAVHASIAAAIAGMGAAARRRADVEGAAVAAPDRPFLCFLDRDPEDLVLGDHKVVGSAQRRRAGAVLQHGSILLGRSPATPELPGLCDLSSATGDPGAWRAAALAQLAAALDLSPGPAEVAAATRLRADQLEARVYRSAAWTRRR